MNPPRRAHARRGRRSTLWLAAGALIVAVVAAALLVTGGHSHPSSSSAVKATTTTASPPRAASTTTSSAPVTTTTVDPGSLPQTDALPTTTTPGFAARMDALWNGVQSGAVADALSAFFPEAAYVQLKDIGDSAGDFTGRLEADYGADVVAAHQLLGSDPATAQFMGVDVDAAYAHWVPPGVCDNGVGYFEVPNSRLLYSIGGQQSSFGIASMISWRGEWYVVHLGAILRSGAGGEVDDPQSGPGAPTYSSTC